MEDALLVGGKVCLALFFIFLLFCGCLLVTVGLFLVRRCFPLLGNVFLWHHAQCFARIFCMHICIYNKIQLYSFSDVVESFLFWLRYFFFIFWISICVVCVGKM